MEMKLRKPILEQISTLKNLPTLPHILLRLIKACNQTKGSLSEVSKIIEKDPSLSSKILRLVNSAYYGLPRKIKKMDSAVALLGTTAIKNVAISASIYEAFKVKSHSIFNLKRYWWHSLRTGILAKRFSQELNYSTPDEAFLTGLLHDIGRLVLWVNFKKQYRGLLELYGRRPDLLLAGEIRLGATHCEVGAWVLEKWNLPSFMVDAVLYHHEPLDRIRNALPLVQIIYAANALSQEPLEAGEQPENLVKELFGFSDSLLQSMVSKADAELAEVARSLDIEIEPPGKVPEILSDKDTEKQLQLIREVQDSSVLLGTLMNLLEARDEPSLLAAVYQGLQILFDVHEVFIFLYDADRQGLISTQAGENEKWKMVTGLFVPLTMSKSLLIRALVEQRVLDSFGLETGQGAIILDEQLIRFMGKEGILCVPMFVQDDHVGVIVIGLNKMESTHLSQQFSTLEMFAKQAAVALRGHRIRKTQLKTIQVERLGASHEMARKVIHEINNPLSIIKNYLKILALKLADQDIAQDEIRIINEEIDRVSQILRDLLAFSDNRSLILEPVNINAILSDMVQLTREPLYSDRGITVHADLDPNLPPVQGNKNGLKQVFINLIKNAAEALQEGGNIFIKTRKITPELEKGSYPDTASVGYAEIVIKDDGPGIPEEMKKRIFEPFATSKGRGHSGLGLSVAHNIIQTLKGSITCESTKGEGTTFTITLPLHKEKTD